MKPALPSPHAPIVDADGRPTPEFFRWMQALTTPSQGWAIPTGASARTAFDTSTVTASQLAERFKALLEDQRERGQI